PRPNNAFARAAGAPYVLAPASVPPLPRGVFHDPFRLSEMQDGPSGWRRPGRSHGRGPSVQVPDESSLGGCRLFALRLPDPTNPLPQERTMNQNDRTVRTSRSDPWAGDDRTLTLDGAHGDRTGMQDESKQIGKIAQWFQESARPFLEKVQPDKVAELDQDLAKLLAVEKLLPTESAICFLGNSGVGKSTLINALVGGSTVLLPSGGIGPLTAQALTVHHGKEPRFEVQYHPF